MSNTRPEVVPFRRFGRVWAVLGTGVEMLAIVLAVPLMPLAALPIVLVRLQQQFRVSAMRQHYRVLQAENRIVGKGADDMLRHYLHASQQLQWTYKHESRFESMAAAEDAWRALEAAHERLLAETLHMMDVEQASLRESVVA